MGMSDYYKFGDVQVIDISRHLTSNAGQAVQYIARSCRLDGNNKGEVESDLRKAIDFLKDELRRVDDQPEYGDSVEKWTEWFINRPEGDVVVTPDGGYWERIGGLWCGAETYCSSRCLARKVGRLSD